FEPLADNQLAEAFDQATHVVSDKRRREVERAVDLMLQHFREPFMGMREVLRRDYALHEAMEDAQIAAEINRVLSAEEAWPVGFLFTPWSTDDISVMQWVRDRMGFAVVYPGDPGDLWFYSAILQAGGEGPQLSVPETVLTRAEAIDQGMKRELTGVGAEL